MGLGALALSAGVSLRAEVPTLQALFPAGGQVGSTFTIAASGKLDDKATLWTETPGLTLTPSGKKREWNVSLSAETKPGLYLIHAVNEDGASEPRWFSVGTLPEITESEPNDAWEKPQVLQQMPVCINGKLDKGGDVDGYSLKLREGQTLVGMVEAYTLGSGVDVMAHVVNEAGERVLTASDGRNLDPVIVFKAPKDGRYMVQIAGFSHPPTADERFTGSATMVYRLHLSSGPVVTQLFPAAVMKSGKTELTLHGHNLDQSKLKTTIDSAQLRNIEDGTAQISLPNTLAPLQIVLCDKAPATEKEPNDTKEQATPVEAGCMGGRITGKEDVDRYAITLKKGDRMGARVWSKELGLPLDSLLKIEGPDGKFSSTSDDSGNSPDPQLQWNAPMDGVYQVIVSDLFHKGSDDASYVLEIGPPQPGYSVALADAKPIVLTAGKTVSLKAKFNFRNGFKGPLAVRMGNLPTGVFCPETPVPEKGGEVELKIQAAANASAASQPVNVTIWDKSDPPKFQRVEGPLRGETLRGTSLRDSGPTIWLTVKAGQ
ncbi:hypothetical protein DES53_110138 [Roseimicrobium gellanilyticum]|uniref:Pre-peptidase n=1 Tax=Roseimicrobium gellanilyticum TaxID=748857 RepID=A0A366HBU4_9BACT|nr:IPT/TIG domain-containing protein [Roseimicrobium gellanilyticum]RBP39114.1 hypothetical protein DES53_110138 [Roseimicrobium gellanilyticum]